MSEVAIRVENLGKRYRLGQVEHYRSLRDVITETVSAPFRKLSSKFGKSGASENSKAITDGHIWALQDVSFEVKRGDAVGIIGRNGAGKSTLLKVLSRITDPTKGFAEIYGRVGALLEVGTGFHPELTGRENIYLNGAILGMRRQEIVRKFDEIVAFAEVEKFLDTMVKYYSSGMYTRLAFAVAAHLEPEILVVDEVLAVGDAEFQKKCLNKMQDVAGEGKTVLFVSHNLAAVQRLCNRGVVLQAGQVVKDGTVDEAISSYMELVVDRQGERVWHDVSQAPGNDIVRLLAVRSKNKKGYVTSEFDVRDPITLEIEYQVFTNDNKLCASIEFINGMGVWVMHSFDNYIYGDWRDQKPYKSGVYKVCCTVPGDLLTDGQMSINLRIFSPPIFPNEAPHIREFDLLSFNILDQMDPEGVRGNFPYNWGSPAVRPKLNWVTEKIS